MSPRSEDQTREILLGDPRIQNDYIARRHKVYTAGNPNPPKKELWSATTKIERAMVECCELGEDVTKLADNEDEEFLYQGGALMPGMEFSFVELLARHAHSPVTRALALAILQHTIEQDEIDAQEEEEKLGGQNVEVEPKIEGDDQQEGDDEEMTADVAKADDDGDKSPEIERTTSTDTNQSTESTKDAQAQSSNRISRMQRFFEAGGMRILKQWLVDCYTPTKKVFSSPSNIAAVKKSVTKTVPSPTGPLLLALLSILEGMPLDKKLVMDCKINKQILKYKKSLAAAVEERRAEFGEEGLEGWAIPTTGGLCVLDVQKAVDSLMEKWLVKIGTATMKVKDPFVKFRLTMRERLVTLVQYDSGKAPKPEWLVALEENERVAKEKKALSKLSTRELEARQRQQERLQNIKATQHKQEEIKEKMAQILAKKREESRKRKAEAEVQVQEQQKKKKAKKVSWKDGFDNSDTLRKRKLLESVYRYPAETSGRWDYADQDTIVQGEGADQEASMTQEEANEAEEDEEDDMLDMFGGDDDAAAADVVVIEGEGGQEGQ
jgi:hypothetical protein